MAVADPSQILNGQVALITGASRGIGRATALQLAGAGARVALVARRPGPLEALAAQLNGWAFPCDVTDPEALDGVRRGLEEVAGQGPDILVAAAGVFHLSPIHEMSNRELDLNLDVNLRGGILTVREFLPGMRGRGRGTIVQVGSVAGRKAFPGNGAYSASKFGIRGFHEVLLEELRGTGIRATLLEPAATDTPIWDPMDPDGNPELPDRETMLAPSDVAQAVHFLVTRPQGVQIPFLPVEKG
jgi:NAD(P)-dependent dehydrogenase (short-subunit alcohol dehydrogenase family)